MHKTSPPSPPPQADRATGLVPKEDARLPLGGPIHPPRHTACLHVDACQECVPFCLCLRMPLDARAIMGSLSQPIENQGW